MVKPWWDLFTAECVDKGLETGKKVVDEDNLIHRIREGERLGKRRYLAARASPIYADAEDYHAWLVFWLALENMSDRNGCFWNKRLEQHQAWSAMHKFVLWVKRQRSRDAQKKPKKANKAIANEPASEEEWSEEEAEGEDMDPEKGIAVIIWHKGMPDELEVEENAGRATLNNLCSYSMLSFWKAVDEAFELPKHMQRRCYLGPKDGSSLRDAQVLANKDPRRKKIIFYLETEPATIPEEAASVPESTLPTHDGDAFREASYRDMVDDRDMVDEAVGVGASRFDMNVRLWKYNLMLAVAMDDAHVDLRDIHLDLQGQTDGDDQDNSAEIQAIQVCRSDRFSS